MHLVKWHVDDTEDTTEEADCAWVDFAKDRVLHEIRDAAS